MGIVNRLAAPRRWNRKPLDLTKPALTSAAERVAPDWAGPTLDLAAQGMR